MNAFPLSVKSARELSDNPEFYEKYSGLTKREYFAIKALQGILANSSEDISEEMASKEAVRFADALLEELDK